MQEIFHGVPVRDLKEIAEGFGTDCHKLSGKTIVLLGGSGFLGTMFKVFFLYLNEKVLAHSCKIISIDNYIGRTPPREIKAPNLTHKKVDLIKDELKITGKVDFVINASGNASPSFYSQFPEETMDVSTIGTVKALELAEKKGAAVIHFSSSEVVGDPPDNEIPTPEESIVRVHTQNKRAPYDITKGYIETRSWVARNKGVNAKVIRPFNVIGYFRQNDFRVIPNFLNSILNNQQINVFAPGTQTRTFCFYTDFIVGVLKVALNGKDMLYNIGNSENEISIKDLALQIEKVCGKENLVKIIPTPETYIHEPKRRCPSVLKAKKELGFNPKVDLSEMLTRIFEWAKVNYKY